MRSQEYRVALVLLLLGILMPPNGTRIAKPATVPRTIAAMGWNIGFDPFGLIVRRPRSAVKSAAVEAVSVINDRRAVRDHCA
jgi:hypothetical protein